jgi:hypothetical protein
MVLFLPKTVSKAMLLFLCQNVQNCHNFNEINMSQMPLETLEIAFRGSEFQKGLNFETP